MTADRWRRVREAFERALEQSPDAPGAWLERQLDADPEIRADLASLIAHHGRAGAFLTDSIAARAPQWLAADDGLPPGRRVGDYAVVREIGRGGMGRVYLAHDERLGRDVAIKALAPDVTADPEHRERFRREARAAAALSHPGICTVFALAEQDDGLFIVGEYVAGRTLREEIAGGRRPAGAEAVAMLRELTLALASAHAKGITHRDLKPENVMRTADGRWKILDFGLARIEPASTGPSHPALTQAGAMIGTPAYMAPEQLNGQPAGPAADVFAFGVLMYEWLTGVHPFAAATPLAVAARVLESDPHPVSAVAPHVPAVVAAIVDRCLRKTPSDRFVSATEMAAALADGAPRAVSGGGALVWWRAHQLVSMAMYVVAVVLGWTVKERAGGVPAVSIFVALGAVAAFSGIMRGHLLFTELVNRAHLPVERRRASRAVIAVDVAMALILVADGLLIAPIRPLWTVFIIALAVAIALAVIVMEPATSSAAFGPDDRAR